MSLPVLALALRQECSLRRPWVVLSPCSPTPWQGSPSPGLQQMPNIASWRWCCLWPWWAGQWRWAGRLFPLSCRYREPNRIAARGKRGHRRAALLPSGKGLVLCSKKVTCKIQVATAQSFGIGTCVSCLEIAFLLWNALNWNAVVCRLKRHRLHYLLMLW